MKNKQQKHLKRILRAQRRKSGKGQMVTIHAKMCCVCCIAEMKFKDEQSALSAFVRSGLDVTATIVDDEGVTHEDIDTFYGFSLDAKEQEEKSLMHLAKKIGVCLKGEEDEPRLLLCTRTTIPSRRRVIW